MIGKRLKMSSYTPGRFLHQLLVQFGSGKTIREFDDIS